MRADPEDPYVFAIEDRSLQLTWGSLPRLDLCVTVGDISVPLPASRPAYLRRRGRPARRIGHGPVGPGAIVVDGLEPSTAYDVCIAGPGFPRRRVGQVTTLDPPPGAVTTCFATINDTHLGERDFGARGTIVDVVPLPATMLPYPERCARAAISEAATWGAAMMVAKGDLTRDSEPAEFNEVGRMLRASPIPVRAILGNHDVLHRVDGPAILARYGIEVARQAEAVDLPGIRLILAHTPLPTNRRGRLGRQQLDRIAELAAGSPSSVPGSGHPGPAVVALHHPPQRCALPTSYPPGMYGPESRTLMTMLRDANPSSIVIAGHTHRNRTYRIDGITVAEIGSTKDYPGQWAGYAVHEGGIRQVVRRVAEPSAIAWTETTRMALHGHWGRWSTSTLTQRCWTQTW